MKNSLIYLSVFVIFLSACRNPEPGNEASYAIFFFEGVLGNDSVKLRAGDDKYYMSPSFTDDSLDIRSFIGKVGRVNCVNSDYCPQSMEISFREKEKGENGRMGINENIKVSTYLFRGPPKFLFTSYKASFYSKSTPVGIDHFWKFGDGTLSTEVNPVHYYLSESDSVINPLLTIQSSSGCQNEISYPTNFVAPCDVDFTASFVSGHLTWSSNPFVGRRELWDLTNGYLPLGTGNLPPSDSVFTACVQSTDTITNCVSYKCKNVVIDPPLVACVANYDIKKESVVFKDVRDYSEVTVKWRDKNGKLYQSNLFPQPLDGFCNVSKVEEYISDRNGNPTKKITLSIKVRLFGEDEDDFLDFKSNKSVIALSYGII